MSTTIKANGQPFPRHGQINRRGQFPRRGNKRYGKGTPNPTEELLRTTKKQGSNPKPSSLSLNSTFRRGTTPATPASVPPQGNMEIELRRKVPGGNSSQNKNRSYHIVEWNGKKYRLTQTHITGSKTENNGYTKEDWEKIANKMTALWDKMNESDPAFAFSSGKLDVNDGTWSHHRERGQPIETTDLNTLPRGTTPKTAQETLGEIQDMFTNGAIQPQKLNSKEERPPVPTSPIQPPPLTPPPSPTPPATPPSNPTPPPPDERPWYARWGGNIKSFFGGN